MKTHEAFVGVGPMGFGISYKPSRLSVGVSLHYWSCISAPAIKLYLGPFKLWGYVAFKRRLDA